MWNILCTRGTSYSVVVSLGTQGGGTSRVMKGISKGDTFSYSICQKEGWMYQQVNGTRCSVKAWYSDVPLTSTGTALIKFYNVWICLKMVIIHQIIIQIQQVLQLHIKSPLRDFFKSKIVQLIYSQPKMI